MLFLTAQNLSAAGVAHGFSLRTGGVSQGPFESLNLSRAVGDDAAAVEENLARLAKAGGVRAFATAHQVHGDRVLLAGEGGSFTELFAATDTPPVSGETNPQGEPADAVVSRTPGLAASVRVADCTPVLLFDPQTRAVAAVHAGWRGARLGIAARGVRALGGDPARLLAAVGPCIGRCCYEVSPELAQTFRALYGDEVADDPAGPTRPHLDLRRAVARSLEEAGVPARSIEQVAGCTSCHAASFFSHRRDHGRTGRHLAFIAP